MQANKVERIDLLPSLSASRAKSEGEKSIEISEGVGSAKEEPNERYNKAQRIIVLDGQRLQQVKVGCKVEQTIVVIDGYAYMLPAGDGCVTTDGQLFFPWEKLMKNRLWG